MAGLHEHRKNAITRLLTDPGFDPNKYINLDESFVEIINYALPAIIKDNNNWLKYFIQGDCNLDVLGKFNDWSNEELGIQIINCINASTDYNAPRTMEQLVMNANQHGLDILADHATVKFLGVQAVSLFTPDQFHRMIMRTEAWNVSEYIMCTMTPCSAACCIAATRITSIEVVEYLLNTPYVDVACTLAARIPRRLWPKAKKLFMEKFNWLECFNCGKVCKSKPGITHHRKKCDKKRIDTMIPHPVSIMLARRAGTNTYHQELGVPPMALVDD